MLFIIALFVFFAVTALKDFGVPFKYWDLIRGLAAATVAVLLVLGRGL